MNSTCKRCSTVFSALILALGTATAFAQPARTVAPPPLPKGQYKFLEPLAAFRTNPGQLASTKGQVQKVLRGEMPLADMPNFDRFFTEYYFRMLTLDDASISNDREKETLTNLRVRLFRDYFTEKATATMQGHLAALTLAEMQKIVKDDFHPANRYNAMLIIGLLNDQEMVRTGENAGKSAPSPHARALQPMLDIYNTADLPDVVKLAGLLGFVRHLEWDPWRSADKRIPVAARKEILEILTALVNAKDPPAGRSFDGHQWMRRKAVEGLGFAAIPKYDAEIIKTLEKVMDDEDDRIEVRTAAATAFGRANLTGVPNFPVGKSLERLVKVTQGVLESEVHRLNDQRKKEETQVGVVGSAQGVGGGGGAMPIMRQEMMRGSQDAEPEDPHFYRVEYSRRKIRAGLFGVEGALNGLDDRPSMNNPRTWLTDRQNSGEIRGLTLLANAKAPPQQKTDKEAVEKLKAEITRLVKIIENDTVDLDRESYEDAIKTAAAEISQAIAVAAPPAKPAAPGDAPVEPAKQPAAAAAVEELPE